MFALIVGMSMVKKDQTKAGVGGRLGEIIKDDFPALKNYLRRRLPSIGEDNYLDIPAFLRKQVNDGSDRKYIIKNIVKKPSGFNKFLNRGKRTKSADDLFYALVLTTIHEFKKASSNNKLMVKGFANSRLVKKIKHHISNEFVKILEHDLGVGSGLFANLDIDEIWVIFISWLLESAVEQIDKATLATLDQMINSIDVEKRTDSVRVLESIMAP